jgi:hypothetical protein
MGDDVADRVEREIAAEHLVDERLRFEGDDFSVRPDKPGERQGKDADICADVDGGHAGADEAAKQLRLARAYLAVFVERSPDIIVVDVVNHCAVAASLAPDMLLGPQFLHAHRCPSGCGSSARRGAFPSLLERRRLWREYLIPAAAIANPRAEWRDRPRG